MRHLGKVRSLPLWIVQEILEGWFSVISLGSSIKVGHLNVLAFIEVAMGMTIQFGHSFRKLLKGVGLFLSEEGHQLFSVVPKY